MTAIDRAIKEREKETPRLLANYIRKGYITWDKNKNKFHITDKGKKYGFKENEILSLAID